MGRSMEYPKKAHTTVHRLNARAKYDLGTIHTIVNETSVLHVSFPTSGDEPFPAVLPMIGTMASFDYPSATIEEPMDCYLHGYVSARLMRLAKDSEKGLPVTISAAKVDGLVLALTPHNHSYNYRSAVLYGYAKPVEKVEEKLYAMEQITNSIVPTRWENSRVPPDKPEMSDTMILKVTVESGSGKIRDGVGHDEAKDTDKEEVTSRVWTGVVPVYESFGEPIESATNKVKTVPEYLKNYATDTTKKNMDYAKSASVEE